MAGLCLEMCEGPLQQPSHVLVLCSLHSSICRCKRGTNSLEGWHKYAKEILHGANNSPELAEALVDLMIWRWSVKAAVKAGQQEFYGTYDFRCGASAPQW